MAAINFVLCSHFSEVLWLSKVRHVSRTLLPSDCKSNKQSSILKVGQCCRKAGDSFLTYTRISAITCLGSILYLRLLSLGVSETVKFVARHTKLCDLLRIFNLASSLTHLRSEKVEKRIF